MMSWPVNRRGELTEQPVRADHRTGSRRPDGRHSISIMPADVMTARTDASRKARPPAIAGEHRFRCSPVRVSTERGFTLLEVLVAFVIAALALAVLFHAGLSGVQAAQSASHYEQAVARARSHLTLAVHASPLVAGDWQGDDGGGFTWHLRVAQIASTAVRPAYAVTPRGSSTFPLTLYAVSVWIGWHDSGTPREVRLDTEQIGQGTR
jgi:general secretion pathway protein I